MTDSNCGNAAGFSDAELVDRFRGLADEAPVMIFLSDLDPLSTRTFFNAGWMAFVDLSEAELSDDGWQKVVHPDDCSHLAATLTDAFVRNVVYTVEYRVRRYDGDWRWIVERGSPRDSGGYAGTAADITDGRLAREELRASERRFRALVEHSSDVVWLVDTQRTIRYASPSTQRVLAFDEAPTLAFDDEQIHPDDMDRMQEAFRVAAQTPGVSALFAVRLRGGDSIWRNVEMVCNNLLHDPEVAGMVFTLRDVTERLQSRETIDRLRDALSSAKADERRELAMALHDDTIQSILAAQWTLASLEGVVDNDSPAAKQLSSVGEALSAAVESARSVLFDLNTPDFASVGLEDALRQLLGVHEMAGGPQVALAFECAATVSPERAGVIYRVVREALTNVRKHAQASRVDIDVVISGDGRCQVDVVDDGQGVKQAVLSEKALAGHFGIASLREQLTRAGGRLVVDGAQGQGTKLSARLEP